MSAAKVVAIVARLSPRPDGSYEGVEDQERQGRAYAAKHWPGIPVEVFADEGISATNGAERPQLDRFREWLAAGRIAQVWAVEQSRLSRETHGRYPWFTLAAELVAGGIDQLHTNRDGVVHVQDEVAGIKAVLAASEVRKLTRRVNDRLAEIAARGEPPGVKPFGYVHARTEDGTRTYAVVPEQAESIRWAADKVLDGWSLSNLAEELDRRGVRGVHGGKITAGSVRGWLTSPSVAGLRVHSGKVVGKGNWTAILDETTWEQVNSKLSANRVVRRKGGGEYAISDRHRGNAVGRKYVMTGGLVVCGVCEAPLIGSNKRMKNGKQKPYLLCHPNKGGKGCVGIMLHETTDYVVDQMFAKLDKPEFLDAIAADDQEARRDELVRALAALGEKRKKLAAQWAIDALTDAEWDAARQGLDEREAELRAELSSIPPPADRFDIATARETWEAEDGMTLDERRQFIRRFVAKVTIGRATLGFQGFDAERVTIEWRRR